MNSYTDDNRLRCGDRVLIVSPEWYVNGRAGTVLHPYDTGSFGKKIGVQVDGHERGRFAFRPDELTPLPEQKKLF